MASRSGFNGCVDGLHGAGTDIYINARANGYTYPNGHADGYLAPIHTHALPYADFDANTYADAHTNPNPNVNSNPNDYTCPHRDPYPHAYSDSSGYYHHHD